MEYLLYLTAGIFYIVEATCSPNGDSYRVIRWDLGATRE